ncbi:MAG: replication and repair protein RecF, partial [Thermomicrobiales bacterium]|nr:replication and repair protein RecF [Thermomicrobiales bacterium]
MRLRALELDEFRSFRRLVLPIDPAGFRAVGPNASGKSTLLEAIAMLATTRSPRTAAEREIAHWDSGVDLAVPPYARLRGEFERSDGIHHVEIGMTLRERGQSSLKKMVRFDDQPVRAVDAVGQFTTVHFSPEDVSLVSGAPSTRRRYLDVAISQSSRPYLRALSRYGRVLEQRNS